MPEDVEIKSSGVLSSLDPRTNMKGFFIFVLAIILVLGAVAYSVVDTSKNVSDSKKTSTPKKSNFKPLSNHSVVYGYWNDKNSLIKAVDLSTGSIYDLADLETNIKKVSIVSPDRLIFINKTDVRDHGAEIASYNMTTRLTTTVVSADPGFGIDDYVMSPEKRYLATWEVSFAPNAAGLLGGRSRVYTVDLSNTQKKNLIYDEVAQVASPVNYPLAITDQGRLFTDKFEPNVGAGWANGVSIASFDGSQKQEVPSMAAGTFGTQPSLSPNGRYLAFAGYDGALGAGTASVASRGNFDQAILNPNTVEVLDTQTLERRKLSNIPNKNRYPNVGWDRGSGKILYLTISRSKDTSGVYLYDLVSSTPTKLKTEGENVFDQYTLISTLDNRKVLTALQDISATSLGNLGEKYAPSIQEISVTDLAIGSRIPIQISTTLVQFINLLPSKYFSDSLVSGAAGIGAVSGRESVDQLQLQTFTIKPTLEPQRVTQQTDPRCRDLAAEQCNAMLGTNFDPKQRSRTPDPQYNQCVEEQISQGRSNGTCSDSPLYLYGKEGTNVDVMIGASVSNSNPAYDGRYSVTLGENGLFRVGNKSYSSIEFDYNSAIKKLPRLDYGKVVSSSKVSDVLKEYGSKLGLNEKEIEDTIKSVSGFSSPYVLVSFYNDETSKAILPIAFNPVPDVYRNVVFYFKPLSAPMSVAQPVFGQIPARQGFTAVEVSYIIDQ